MEPSGRKVFGTSMTYVGIDNLSLGSFAPATRDCIMDDGSPPIGFSKALSDLNMEWKHA